MKLNLSFPDSWELNVVAEKQEFKNVQDYIRNLIREDLRNRALNQERVEEQQ